MAFPYGSPTQNADASDALDRAQRYLSKTGPLRQPLAAPPSTLGVDTFGAAADANHAMTYGAAGDALSAALNRRGVDAQVGFMDRAADVNRRVIKAQQGAAKRPAGAAGQILGTVAGGTLGGPFGAGLGAQAGGLIGGLFG